ncbi:MAG: CCA tRNA nucleotidyltransferase [Clostridia bacterium]|nr:CCA tRNA nucleotidyltransferase [Clostridia bacterium]
MKKASDKANVVINRLCENGYEAYLVGGCVRDMLSGKTPHDFDITTNALPDEIKAVFEKTVDTGLKHGTVTVIVDDTPIEVTTYRSDGEYLDMRRPERVKFVSDLKEDLARRDFTVNAMAYNEIEGVVDYFGGKEDLEKGILRAVGDPEKRFNEDALRIMRLVRFASVLGFTPEEKTFAAAKKLCKNLKNISGERIWAEFSKLLSGNYPDAVREIIALGGLEYFGITGDKSLKVIARLPQKTELRFFAFCRILDIDTETVIKKLKIKNSIKNYCEKCDAATFLDENSDDFNIKTALEVAGTQAVSDIIDYKTIIERADLSGIRKRAERILRSAEPYRISDLKLNGNDLLALGYSGKEIGRILKELCDTVKRDPEKNRKEALIFIAKK